jgi:hypothetical protein
VTIPSIEGLQDRMAKPFSLSLPQKVDSVTMTTVPIRSFPARICFSE